MFIKLNPLTNKDIYKPRTIRLLCCNNLVTIKCGDKSFIVDLNKCGNNKFDGIFYHCYYFNTYYKYYGYGHDFYTISRKYVKCIYRNNRDYILCVSEKYYNELYSRYVVFLTENNFKKEEN